MTLPIPDGENETRPVPTVPIPKPGFVAEREARQEKASRIKQAWFDAASYFKSVMSRGLFGAAVKPETLTERHVSCFGCLPDGTPVSEPCEALACADDGYFYCNGCGCGQREEARLVDGDYPKLLYPYLICPKGRKGFSSPDSGTAVKLTMLTISGNVEYKSHDHKRPLSFFSRET